MTEKLSLSVENSKGFCVLCAKICCSTKLTGCLLKYNHVSEMAVHCTRNLYLRVESSKVDEIKIFGYGDLNSPSLEPCARVIFTRGYRKHRNESNVGI